MTKGIYKITNDRTGEVYVGQAKDLKRRENTHFRQLAQGKHHNSGLQEDHDKGDTFSFEVIEELPDATLADLKNKESHYINKFNSFREGYNQTPGGAMDQFQGRYEYGGGRLPVEKYQPTNKYLTKNIIYCPECGTNLELEDIYCSNCGEKIDRIAIDLEESNIEGKTAKNNENNDSSSKRNAILIVIILCILIISLYLYNQYGISVILFFINIIGNVIVYFVFIGIIFFLCAYIMGS